VLAGEAEILLLDEPTTNLDPRHRLLVAEIVRRRAAAGSAVVLSTHELDLASAADRAVLLKGGRLLAEGEAAATLTEPNLEDLFSVPVRVLPEGECPPSMRLGPIR
jgi:iron complex transport system ATP-binding protein